MNNLFYFFLNVCSIRLWDGAKFCKFTDLFSVSSPSPLLWPMPFVIGVEERSWRKRDKRDLFDNSHQPPPVCVCHIFLFFFLCQSVYFKYLWSFHHSFSLHRLDCPTCLFPFIISLWMFGVFSFILFWQVSVKSCWL